MTTRKLMFSSSLRLGLNAYGHFCSVLIGSGYGIKSIPLPILSGYLESMLQVPQSHRFSIFVAKLNAAARVLTRSRKYDHITTILQSLHWLLIKFCISYKILLLGYKALNDLVPEYLTNLLSR